ncbi:Zn-ribbon domain-containing OB-fold protein [Nocardia sp. CA-135953]|uniref:Zn-ribbon domain-containing OB-fold protein n=1 Tax=Nocardia sp. CA-135953 TaxID=3239978 RepID=UPI003D9939BD
MSRAGGRMQLSTFFHSDSGAVFVHGSRCTDCRAAAFPARQVCAVCASRNLEREDLAARGRVRATSLVRTPPFGFDQPITVGVVVLDSGPALFSLLASELPAGSAVQAVPGPVRAGAEGFVFERVME